MGNYVSCALASSNGGKSGAAKVIFPGGEIRVLTTPTKVAELMLEEPSSFLVNSHSLHIGRRFSALGADEDLEMGHVYVMFPMKRLSSVATAADMGTLFVTTNGSMRRQASSGKVIRLLPDPGRGAQIAPSPAPEIEELSTTPVFSRRLSVCRSKKPSLETISEEPLTSPSSRRRRSSSY